MLNHFSTALLSANASLDTSDIYRGDWEIEKGLAGITCVSKKTWSDLVYEAGGAGSVYFAGKSPPLPKVTGD